MKHTLIIQATLEQEILTLRQLLQPPIDEMRTSLLNDCQVNRPQLRGLFGGRSL